MFYKNLSRFLVVLMAASFVFVTVGAAVAAQESKDEKILEKVSKEAGKAMQEVRFARVAIFDGQPGAAEKFLDSAKKNLGKAEKEAPELIVTVKSEEKIGNKMVAKHEKKETTELVPIDAWLGLSDDFVPSPEKQAKIKQANKHLRKGESAKAIGVLREADIGVSVTRLLMPLKATNTHVDKAIALLKDHKYYEANLALKGAEDGLIVDTILLYEPLKPEQKSKSEKK